MAESVLINAATVEAAASSAVVAFAAAEDEYVDFRVSCDQAHSVAFYVADATFSAITSASKIFTPWYPGLASTSGTTGNIFTVWPGSRSYVACVVTNNGSSAATVTVGAENG